MCKCKIKCQDQKNFRLVKLKNFCHYLNLLYHKNTNNKANALSFLNSSSVDDISESIYNILYNENLNLNLSKSQKTKLKKIIKPNVKVFEDISKRNVPKTSYENYSTRKRDWYDTFNINSCSIFIID